MRILCGVVALSLSAGLSVGCGIQSRGSFSARFVKAGKPAIDLGGPAPDQKATKKQLQAAQDSKAKARSASFGTSIENTDVRLSAALVVEHAIPTPENYLRVALEYKRLGILDTCADHLTRALEIAPQFAPAHEELARVWRDWGFPQLGLASAHRAIYYAPHSASAQNTLGTLLAALGQIDEAEHAFRHALSIDPNAAWAYNNLCDLERRSGRFEAARADCEAALRAEPSLAATHNNLALILAESDDLVGAREQFLAAGDEATADYNIGILQLAKGDYAAAAAAFEKAIQARPGFTAAKERAHAARLFLLTGGH